MTRGYFFFHPEEIWPNSRSQGPKPCISWASANPFAVCQGGPGRKPKKLQSNSYQVSSSRSYGAGWFNTFQLQWFCDFSIFLWLQRLLFMFLLMNHESSKSTGLFGLPAPSAVGKGRWSCLMIHTTGYGYPFLDKPEGMKKSLQEQPPAHNLSRTWQDANTSRLSVRRQCGAMPKV